MKQKIVPRAYSQRVPATLPGTPPDSNLHYDRYHISATVVPADGLLIIVTTN